MKPRILNQIYSIIFLLVGDQKQRIDAIIAATKYAEEYASNFLNLRSILSITRSIRLSSPSNTAECLLSKRQTYSITPLQAAICIQIRFCSGARFNSFAGKWLLLPNATGDHRPANNFRGWKRLTDTQISQNGLGNRKKSIIFH